MINEQKAKILEARKQKIYCDECGKEVYRHYPKGIRLLCFACSKQEQEIYISENQMKFSYFLAKV